MKPRKFSGTRSRDVLEQVRNELGQDAIIVSNRATVDGIEVLAIAGVAGAGEDAFIARARHLVALREAATHLAEAAGHLRASAPPLELYAEELREAQRSLAAITGEFTADDLLGEIFGRFCIGK